MARLSLSHRLVLAVALLPALAAAPCLAEPGVDAKSAAKGLEQMRQLQDAFAAIAEKVAPAVVAVQARRKLSTVEGLSDKEDYLKQFGDRLVPAVGSGILIDPAGYILTNEHVIASAEELTVVLANRHRFAAKVIGSDARSDLAIVKIEGKDFPAAPLGDVSTVRQGHWSIAMGNAFGLAGEGRPSMTIGVVSAIGRALPNFGGHGDRHYGNLIQTSADINPGNSGGPLLNMDGQVVGINTAISSRTGVSEGVGFAIPMTARTKAIIETLKAGRKIEYGFLGVVVRSPQPEESARAGAPAYAGAVVDMVESTTPAAKATIKVGDIIVQVDEDSIEDSDHLVRVVGGSPIGRPISVVLWRDRKKLTVSAVLDKRSDMLARHKPEPDSLQWRGLTVGELTEDRRKALGLARNDGGVEILAVRDKSPAHAAGLKAGEVIARLDGKPARSLDEFRKLSESLDDGKEASIQLLKGGTRTIKPARSG